MDGRKKKNKPRSTKDEWLPLRGFLECSKCGNILTGSFSKGRTKKYGYCHCQRRCKERNKSEQTNQDFIAYLNNFEIKDEVLSLYYLVLQDVFGKDKKEREKECRQIDSLIKIQNNKLDALLDKYTDDLLTQSDYERGKKRCEEKIYSLQSQKQELELEQKDFMTTVQYSFGLLKDLSKYYKKASVEVKQKIVGSIFPKKLIYQEKNYRTAQVNQALALICGNINDFGEIKQKRTTKIDSPSF